MNAESKSAIFHEDVFYTFFEPYRHPASSNNVWGGLGLETFGKDIDLVRSLDEAYVWTIVEGGSHSTQWVVPGVHRVNRVCYLVTMLPHNWVSAEFRIADHGSSLTPTGLKRQCVRLEKLLAKARVGTISAA